MNLWFHTDFLILITDNKTNIIRFTIVMHAPVGTASNTRVSINPMQKLTNEITAEQILTDLNDLKTLIAESAGNTIRPDIKSAPISLIPITTVRAVSTARRYSIKSTFKPVALEKSASNVTEKILW